VDPLRDMLVPRFLTTSPLRVYALASHWGFDEEAKLASKATLTMDVSKGFPEEDTRLMGSVACQKLYLLHLHRRDKVLKLVSKLPCRPSDQSCSCRPTDLSAVMQALSQCLAAQPWLAAEELYEKATKRINLGLCMYCRSSSRDIQKWFSSISKGISELPQTS